MHDDLLERAREAAYLPPDAPPAWDLIEVMGRAWMGEAQGVEAIAAQYLSDHRPGWHHVARIEGAHPWAALEARILACPELPLPVAERSEPDSIRSACALWRAALEGGDHRQGVTPDEEARWRVWLCAWVGGWRESEALARFLLSVLKYKCKEMVLPDGELSIHHKRRSGAPQVCVSYYHPNRLFGCSGVFISHHMDPNELDDAETRRHSPLYLHAEQKPFTPKTVAKAAQQCLIRIPDRIVTHFGLRRWQTSLGFEV